MGRVAQACSPAMNSKRNAVAAFPRGATTWHPLLSHIGSMNRDSARGRKVNQLAAETTLARRS